MSIASLSPQIVWQHFAAMCAIPRASLHEAALREYLIAWATPLGISTQVDAAGNLILRKAASAGYEMAPGVVLQGHLDMVCQANSGTQHDFFVDPIQAVIRENWVVAENTTLGADNGIGVALALAALQADIPHPALEVLLTVNEESGMDGARELKPGTLQGKLLINMDSEEWGHFYLGCAGGVDVKVTCPTSNHKPPADYQRWQLRVTGLRGGHSGIDIHLNSGNAIKLLASCINELNARYPLHVLSLQGGTARNAIPREAFAELALPATVDLNDWILQTQQRWQQQYAVTDPKLQFSGQRIANTPVDTTLSMSMLAFLAHVTNGVTLTSQDFPNVTDTSCNLGVVTLVDNQLQATFKVRSLHDARAQQLATQLCEQAAEYGLAAHREGAYPGWTPNPHSPLLAVCQQVYRNEFAAEAGLQVIHAGLECGIISASHPQLDMISFGPDIRGAHAPGERVEINSVAHCWQLLQALLKAIK